MKRKSAWLAALICLNLVLITALVVCGAPPRAAAAQGAGMAGNYLVISGRVQNEFDALYLLDGRERALHVLFFPKGSHELQYVGPRDLERDFRSGP